MNLPPDKLVEIRDKLTALLQECMRIVRDAPAENLAEAYRTISDAHTELLQLKGKM